jgi:probable rRNA maturation factor
MNANRSQAAMPAGPSSLVVEVSDTQAHLQVDPESLAGLARRVLRGEEVESASISIALVDDATIHALNRRHLGHDWPTDVITFRLSEPGEPVPVGELVISAEMASTTARASGFDPGAELALYLVHGLLHLCGYDDRSAEDVAAIRRREAEILAAEGLINTFPLVGGPEAEAGRECARWTD